LFGTTQNIWEGAVSGRAFVVRKETGDPLVADVATLRTGPFALMPPLVIVKLGQVLYGYEFHVAQVWNEVPPEEPVEDNTRGSPVSFALFPARFQAARVKLVRLSMAPPPNPVHQSPVAESVCLATGEVETSVRVERANSEARSPVNMSGMALGGEMNGLVKELGSVVNQFPVT